MQESRHTGVESEERVRVRRKLLKGGYDVQTTDVERIKCSSLKGILSKDALPVQEQV